jgi:hypothetical protein
MRKLIIFILLLTASLAEGAVIGRKYKFCRADSECALVDTSCCGCPVDGTQVVQVVNRKYKARFAKKYERACRKRVCLSGARVDLFEKCGHLHASCVAGLCTQADQ